MQEGGTKENGLLHKCQNERLAVISSTQEEGEGREESEQSNDRSYGHGCEGRALFEHVCMCACLSSLNQKERASKTTTMLTTEDDESNLDDSMVLELASNYLAISC